MRTAATDTRVGVQLVAQVVTVCALLIALALAAPGAALAHHATDHTGGSGQEDGQPCDGCVGNADDHTPPGQSQRPDDANAGHECDRNQGIGRGNPAHTGCLAEPEAPEGPGVVAPETEDPVAVVALPSTGAGPAAGDPASSAGLLAVALAGLWALFALAVHRRLALRPGTRR